MLFSSIGFLYYFLPCVLVLYFLMPFRFKNLILIIASLFFYFYGEPIYTLIILGTAFSSYLHGILIDKYRGSKISKLFLISSVVTSLLLLGIFKYCDFFISNINAVFNSGFSLLKIALPIGISFYTLKTMSYTIDVYRGETKVQKSFIKLAAYVTLFPQLIAGPIVRYSSVSQELSVRKHSFENFAYGVNRFIIGLSKKVLLADALGELCTIFRESDEKTVAFYWLYAIAFSLRIYFDFSGYSDMAIGLGRIFGFHFPENFDYPYIAKSVTEFWRRWHISLGTWFHDYVYTPLGGSRVSKQRWVLNVFIICLLFGFWHGADWIFVIWGLYFAVLLLFEKLFYQKLLGKIPVFFSHAYLILIIVIGFVIFNANGMAEAIIDLKGMFGFFGLPFWNSQTAYYAESYGVLLLAAIIGATPFMKKAVEVLKKNTAFNRICSVFEPILHIILLFSVTSYLVDGSFKPFIYYKF